jgi:hypothetical protein
VALLLLPPLLLLPLLLLLLAVIAARKCRGITSPLQYLVVSQNDAVEQLHTFTAWFAVLLRVQHYGNSLPLRSCFLHQQQLLCW